MHYIDHEESSAIKVSHQFIFKIAYNITYETKQLDAPCIPPTRPHPRHNRWGSTNNVAATMLRLCDSLGTGSLPLIHSQVTTLSGQCDLTDTCSVQYLFRYIDNLSTCVINRVRFYST